MPSSGKSKRPKNLRKSHCGLQWLCVNPARHVDWLARLLAENLSQRFDRALSNSQSDFISTLCRPLCLTFSATAIFLEVSNNKNVDALKHTKFPAINTQLKNFLGMCNVYRRFVKDFAKRAKPLNALTRAQIPPDPPPPTDVAIAAFEDVRNALLCAPALALSKDNRKLVVDVVTCVDQVRRTLLQEEPGELLHSVGYWSRGLSAAEKNYSATEREFLGVVWAVLKLRHFLDGRRFLIRTNHQALSWIYSTTDSSGR